MDRLDCANSALDRLFFALVDLADTAKLEQNRRQHNRQICDHAAVRLSRHAEVIDMEDVAVRKRVNARACGAF